MDAYDYFSVVLNRDNVVEGLANGYTNTLVYDFGKTVTLPPNSDICFKSGSVYYSWPNVDHIKYGQAEFRLVVPCATSNQTTPTDVAKIISDYTYASSSGGTLPTTINTASITVSLPDGMYEINDMNNYMEEQCIANSLYYIYNKTGLPGATGFDMSMDQKYYFFQILVDAQTQNVVLLALPVFSSTHMTTLNLRLPTMGALVWAPFTNDDVDGIVLFDTTTPVAVNAESTQPQTPMMSLLGFTTNIASFMLSAPSTIVSAYPAPLTRIWNTGSISTESTAVPNINPQSTILLGCSLVNNGRFVNATSFDIFYAFTTSVAKGEIQELTTYNDEWNSVNSSSITSFTVTMYDQRHSPLNIKDPNIFFLVTIRVPKRQAYFV